MRKVGWQREFIRTLISMSLLLGLCELPTLASAEVVALHEGAVDPATGDWTAFDGAALRGPEDDSGTPVWSIEDTSPNGGLSLQYQITPTPQQLLRASQNGWSLRTRLRVVGDDDAPDFNVSVGWSNANGMRFEMLFGSDSDGDPIVVLHPFDGAPQGSGEQRFVLEGGSQGVHEYELRFERNAVSADLYVDGTRVLEGYGGFQSNTDAFVGWGDRTNTASVGHGHYNLVTFVVFEAFPVPQLSRAGAIALAVLLALGLCIHSMRSA